MGRAKTRGVKRRGGDVQRASRRGTVGGAIFGRGGREGAVGDGELVAVVAAESTREAMAGIAQVFRFVAFSSHWCTPKFGNSVNPVVLGGRTTHTKCILYQHNRIQPRPYTVTRP